ncbi:hypothetical protein HHI36_018715 [Cryptolaemus montrouzieri]|uniref:Uncharacterized protein n=1 Tax=Cryptolaemus montrouzieri TaxID=559131 RepID=A0ABD2P1F6_9CUCU
MSKIKKLEMGKNFSEKYIDDQTSAKLRSCDVWLGAKEDLKIFKFYERVEKSLKNLASNSSKSETNNNVPEITLQLTNHDHDTSTEEEEGQESGDSLDDISDDIMSDEHEIDKSKLKQVFRTVVEVMAMVSCDESNTVFEENENEKDISEISLSQIIKNLDAPKMIVTGDRIKYKFDI